MKHKELSKSDSLYLQRKRFDPLPVPYLFSIRICKGLDHDFIITLNVSNVKRYYEFEDDKVIKNGEILDEPYIKEPAQYYQVEKVIVPEGHIFVMGDNRNNSRHSRNIGCIPTSHVIGKYKFKF
jgi:signal peptidase I